MCGGLPRQFEEVLRRTMDWVKASEVAEHALWVHGPSCTSPIAQAVASLQEEDPASLATYFISRDSGNKDVRARFISTILYQLGQSFPSVLEKIGHIIAHDPAILSRSVSHQLETLILHPLAPFLSASDDVGDSQHHPIIIIVDGCDHLDNYTQTCIVNALLKLARQFPSRIRILLFTKLSLRITTSLTLGVAHGSVAEIHFRGEWSFGAIVEQVWNRAKDVVRKNPRTR